MGVALEVADELEAMFSRAKLTARQRELFVRHVGRGESLTDLAVEQGVSRPRAGNMVTVAMVKLRALVG